MTADDDAERAEFLARQMERDIIEENEFFGLEKELTARYQVSGVVLRRAARLLEGDGVIEIRKSQDDGLIIRRAARDPVTDAAAVYLGLKQVIPDELEQARMPFETFCVQQVANRISADGAASIRSVLKREKCQLGEHEILRAHEFHVLIAELTGNPVLHLLVRTVAELTQRMGQRRGGPDPETVHNAHCEIADAIIAGDAALARHRMVTHLEAVSRALTGQQAGVGSPPGRIVRGLQ